MNKNIRLVAFLLALVMMLTLSGCPDKPNTPATEPTTTVSDPVPTTSSQPNEVEYDAAFLEGLIGKLRSTLNTVSTDTANTVALLISDFTAKPEGINTPEFQNMLAAVEQTRKDRSAALSEMIRTLEKIDLKDTANVAAKVAKAEWMIAQDHHAYGEKISHSRNVEGAPCTEVEYYQICSMCNAVVWSKGEHQWYYSRSTSEHQKCCRLCSETEAKSQHAVNDQGKCSECNYTQNANILIIESISGESDKLSAMIDSGHTVTVVDVTDSARMPASIDDLKTYDEVILVNIANRDMPQGFDKLLQSYVHDFGGGLLTVGGNTADSTPDDWMANAYDRADLQGTVYQDMLPVDILDTVSSIGVVIIIDRSGSMWNQGGGQPYEKSMLYAAKLGAEACLGQLQDDDYVGILPLGDYAEKPEMIPRLQRDKIIKEIDSIELGGGTIFSIALDAARQALLANTQVQRRHIIMITDGLPAMMDREMYIDQAKKNAQAGITMSIVGIGCDNYTKQEMAKLLKSAGGEEKHFYDAADTASVSAMMQEALRLPELRGITFDRFIPDFSPSFILPEMSQEQMPPLDGTYRSKLKDGAAEILSSRYGPLYAQWSYGKGKVGSFMCDLNGNWSSDFLNSEEGAELLNNIIIALFAGS